MVQIHETTIPGLLEIRIDLHEDSRGWFKENWQREKMVSLGLPDFEPVQNNISYNRQKGVTRGIHVEPWDKLVSVTSGEVFACWVDLREGNTFGQVHYAHIGPNVSFFVPEGVGNSYQTLEDNTVYSYLVNRHWSPNSKYVAVNAFDPVMAIPWPIDEKVSLISPKDKENPVLSEVAPVKRRGYLVVGQGQLGKAIMKLVPDATLVTREQLNLENTSEIFNFDFSQYSVVINAAAYTQVDKAEKEIGAAWKVNAVAVQALAEATRKSRSKLVHISSDYIFDGTLPVHDESEKPSPLGVYGASKAAGDLLAATNPNHLIIRTSWVIGEGSNFIETMLRLESEGRSPSVVNDQFGRPTFASDLAEAILHLLNQNSVGIFNVTNDGPVTTWFEIARLSAPNMDVSPVSSEEYLKPEQSARPRNSVLDMQKLNKTGFHARDWRKALDHYLTNRKP